MIFGQLPHLGRSSEPPNPLMIVVTPAPAAITHQYTPSLTTATCPHSFHTAHTGPPTVSLQGTITAGWPRTLGLNMPLPPPPPTPTHPRQHLYSHLEVPFVSLSQSVMPVVYLSARSKDQGRKPGCGLCYYDSLSILVRIPDVCLRSLDAHPPCRHSRDPPAQIPGDLAGQDLQGELADAIPMQGC